MTLGVLSDVHGNRTALEAVIADGTARGVTKWWVIGDLVAIGPDPVATLELLANMGNLVATSGNTERGANIMARSFGLPGAIRSGPKDSNQLRRFGSATPKCVPPCHK